MTIPLSRIKDMLAQHPSPDVLEELRADPRRGVQQLLAAWTKKQERVVAEKFRLLQLRTLEQEEWNKGRLLVAGCDEAGRGPLAGPLVTAAVILPGKIWLPGLNDSKKITQKRREALYEAIKEQAVAITLCLLGPQEIDRLNIYQAAKRSMELCLTNLNTAPQAGITDAMPLVIPGLPVRDFVHGDARSACIAAASIMAKVTRDRFMVGLDAKYPAYGFAHNKGYGAKEHMKALEKWGATPWHRHSFAPVKTMEHVPDALSLHTLIRLK